MDSHTTRRPTEIWRLAQRSRPGGAHAKEVVMRRGSWGQDRKGPRYCQGQCEGVISLSPENSLGQLVAMDMSTGPLPPLQASSSWRRPQDGSESPLTMHLDTSPFITWPSTPSTPLPQFSSQKLHTLFILWSLNIGSPDTIHTSATHPGKTTLDSGCQD